MLYRPDREIARAVRQLLAAGPLEGLSYASVARHLHLSPRTLHRRLALEGTSYRALRDAVRREQALQMLEKTAHSIADIATALGYSEPSAFFRAFVAWTGMAPTLYRNRNRFA
jgi:AraC-like DNA-binding protein